ncbi:hypothetical protein [Streptomyces cacaoi]|nr:hypothetical protein [Streptomyces cacaoi]
MSERRLRNPDNFVSEQAGEYSYRYSESAASGFAPSKGEVALLERLAHKTRLHSTPVDRNVGIARRRFYPYEPNDNTVWGPSDGASLWFGG